MESINEVYTKRKLSEYFVGANPKGKVKSFNHVAIFCWSAVDFLEHVLTMDPTDRYSAEQALHHPYVAKFSDPSDEVCLTISVHCYMCYAAH